MKKTCYTVMVIPEKRGTVRRISLSVMSLLIVCAACVGILASTTYLYIKNVDSDKTLVELERYKKITEEQKDKINMLAEKVGEFEKELEMLRITEKKLKTMTNFRSSSAANEFLGVGGYAPDAGEDEYQSPAFERSRIADIDRSVDELFEEVHNRQKSFQELIGYFVRQQAVLAATPSRWPVGGVVTSEYGYRISPFSSRKELHQGIDIATRLGEAVRAPASGVVKKRGYERGLGYVVTISHGYGFTTLYAHLSEKSRVRVGQKVKRGDVIGYVGMTGRTTGPHLHYSVSVKGRYVNPRKYLL